MAASKEGTVNIHGKTYLTVALRVANFRAEHPDWGIGTELISRDAESVVMRAQIGMPDPTLPTGYRIIGTGFAEERRDSSQINKTSALENCETSAIGRALAACGYGGTEYASANEVENAIHQQRSTAVTSVVLEQTPSMTIDAPMLDESEMSIRRAIRDYGDEVINAEGLKLQCKEAVFDLTAEYKIALWKRFSTRKSEPY